MGSASYPPHVPARKRAPVTHSAAAAAPAAAPAPEERLNGASTSAYGPAVDALLISAVDEAARLLDADGAMVYLLDPETEVLRFAFDAGIQSEQSRRLVRRIELPVGVGMFGRAVADRAVCKTDDYAHDEAFAHDADADRVVDDSGIRSMVVAPMVNGDEVFGAFGTFSTRTGAFNPAQIALVRALADHAAGAIANARLIGDLDRSRRELAQRAEIERSLREIAARISSASDLDSVLQRTVDEASRLIHADGAILDVLDPETDVLHWAFDSGLSLLFSAEERADLWIENGVGATGRALAENRVIVAGDNLVAEFPLSSQSELFFGRTGFRSMIAAPIAGDTGRLGVLEVYSRRPDAFDASDGQLIQTLASQAAIAITNARLIEELARSRGEQARAAEAERALREIAARMTAMRDQDEILEAINQEAARLLRGTGAMINLTGETATLNDTWTHLPERATTIRDRIQLLEQGGLEEDAGVSGRALRTRQVEWTDDYLLDERFEHTAERDEFVREAGVRSVISAPLVRDDEVLGVLTVYADPPGAFGAEDAALLGALAAQGAVTIMNARLIEELERSREEVAKRADSERTLREIAARVSAILEPGEVLQRIVDEAARLLESDGARIDLYDDELGILRWGYAAGDAMKAVPDWAVASGLLPRQGVAGLAFAEQRALIAEDYTTDDRFETTDGITAFVRDAGIRAVLAAPLPGEDGPIGVISVVSRTPGVYRDVDAELLNALASQASIALVNARLMQALEGSQAVIERRAGSEQALREIAARITAIREPGDLLQHVVEESARLLRADGALLELYDAESRTLQYAYDSGLPESQRRGVQGTAGKLGEGVSGKAITDLRVIVVDDYLTSDEFVHTPKNDKLAKASKIRSLIAAPIVGEDGPLGTIEVFRRKPAEFDQIDAAVLGGLADQAAVAITNARLIAELARSREEIEHRAERERTLRDIAARIASLRDPVEVLLRVVEEAKRLLASDGAHLTRLDDDGLTLLPEVVAGGDEALADWIKTQRFPVGEGINGLAARDAMPVWTEDYLAEERIPLEKSDVVTANRLGLRGMAAAPLRSPSEGVIGTLAISYREPRSFDPEELDLLQGLADQAAIAIANAGLLERVGDSERRYRHLVQNSADMIWSIGPDATFTFLSDTCERLTGWSPQDLLGKHFGALVHPSSEEVATLNWVETFTSPSQEVRGRVNLLRRDGGALPAEFTAMATLDADGAFAGVTGSVRDMTETDRLERELRDSENRYRDLASSSPDMVFATDPEGRYTFVSDAAASILGWDRDEAMGRPFTDFVPEHALPLAGASYAALIAAPEQVQHSRIPFRHADGREIPLEINVVGSVENGRLVGIHGVARDVSDRERLERELQESEARFRQIVQATPDVIWRCDAAGRFTFIADGAIELFGWTPEQIVGKHFGFLILDESLPEAIANFEQLAREPEVTLQLNYQLRRRDGSTFRSEVTAIGLTEDGTFVGAQGTVRDISERERLERELRRQAGELASSEERAHLARELHDSVTQALFSMTLVARSIELLLERDPDQARTQLAQLRELQREALAEMRALIFELRPGNVEQDGLVRALRTHSAALQGRIGLPIVVESEIDDRLPLEVEETLYRISQEALHNVVKHAAARQVRIELDRARPGIRLRIIDDGKGFDPTAVPDSHLGIAGMRARASKIGARLECLSEPGRGTTIEVAVPDEVIERFPASSLPTAPTPSVR
jgi:PAS domain S-box-containing protein